MTRIVLAYSGGSASSIALHWLAETTGADIVTITLDVGQGDELPALRARALSCGATRAHAFDAREELVREFLLPSLADGPLANGALPPIGELAHSLIARKLLEVARIEGTSVVAHGASDASIDAAVRALDPRVTILAPARDWPMDAGELTAYAHARGVAASASRIDQNLGGRMTSLPDGVGRAAERPRPLPAQTEPASLDVRFEGGVPVSINDVPMSPVELVESLALIAGRYGVGRFECNSHGRTVVYDAPAATVLRLARAAVGEPTGVVRLSVLPGTCTVLDPNTQVVSLA